TPSSGTGGSDRIATTLTSALPFPLVPKHGSPARKPKYPPPPVRLRYRSGGTRNRSARCFGSPVPPVPEMAPSGTASAEGSPGTTIHVCQSGTCLSKGADATLVEIEELAGLVGGNGCGVEPTGCLGYCRRGPAVAVAKKGARPRYFVGIKTPEKSADVVERATGEKLPPLEDLPAGARARMETARASKRIEYLTSAYRWNEALACLLEQASRQPTRDPGLEQTTREILRQVGYGDLSGGLSLTEMPASVSGYVPWTLVSAEAVSAHSAVFRFETRDPKRGTPHPRGRGRMPNPVTWHTTMLGAVGANPEGPLPWIERDYTPISSALEWERGRCSILIKIYGDGALTQWLVEHAAGILGGGGSEPPVRVWLSKPVPTLSVPSLVPATSNGDGAPLPGSVLLLLAGTGIVALPQVLAHREPHRFLGISTPRNSQLRCPIDVVHSCREDDLLMLPSIGEWCLEGTRPHPRFRGIRRYDLLVTGASTTDPPFSGCVSASGGRDPWALVQGGLPPNATVHRSRRLTEEMVGEALGRAVRPCRVVVSGPDAFNEAARSFCLASGLVEPGQVTVLAA
ncbi:unnamed protein product, partial [Pseudo-nitzschia multistriata]